MTTASDSPPDSPCAQPAPKRRRRWLRRLLLSGLVLLLVLTTAAWFGRDALLNWAGDRLISRLERDGIYLSLEDMSWGPGGRIKLEGLELHEDVDRTSGLLQLSNIQIQPDYGGLIRNRQLDLNVNCREDSLWLAGMKPDDRVSIGTLDLRLGGNRNELMEGNLMVGGIEVRAAGRIAQPPSKEEAPEELDEPDSRSPEERANDLAGALKAVGSTLAQVEKWTRLSEGDTAPVLNLTLDDPTGGLSVEFSGEGFTWSGVPWESLNIVTSWDGEEADFSTVRLVAAGCEVTLDGGFQAESQTFVINQWRIAGNPLGPLAEMAPSEIGADQWEVIKPVVIEGRDVQVPLRDLSKAAGSLVVSQPGELRWKRATPGGGDVVLTLDQWQLETDLANGVLSIPELRLGGYLTDADGNERPAGLRATDCSWNLAEAVAIIPEAEIEGDLLNLVTSLLPDVAAALEPVRWSGAGLRVTNARIPFDDPLRTTATVATTSPGQLAWRAVEDREPMQFDALEIEGTWRDRKLTLNRIEADWLGGRLSGELHMPMTDGFDGLAGSLTWTDANGPLVLPFTWSVSDNRLVIHEETTSNADLIALWKGTPWGHESLPEGLAFNPPPGLTLVQPLIIPFKEPSAIELEIHVTETGTVNLPVGEDQILEVGIEKLRTHMKNGLWTVDQMQAQVAQGQLTGSANSRPDGKWEVDAEWADGDVPQLLASFGVEREELEGSRCTVTFTGDAGASLEAIDGSGKVEMEDAPLVNVFVLREIYQLLAIVLPVFKSPEVGTASADYRLSDGILEIDDFAARSDTVGVEGDGTIDFNHEQLDIEASVDIKGVVGLATAIASRAIEVKAEGQFDDFKVRLSNASVLQDVGGAVIDSSKVVVQSGYKAPIKILEIGADGGVKVLGEGLRVIGSGAELLKDGAGGVIGSLPFLGGNKEKEKDSEKEQPEAETEPEQD